MISLKYGIVTNYLVLYENKLVLKTWLNETYWKDSRFKKVDENGKTGWPTIYVVIRVLQIEYSRYSQYKHDRLDFFNIDSSEKSIKNVMNSILTKFPMFGLNLLKENSTEAEQNACFSAFAYYLLRNIH